MCESFEPDYFDLAFWVNVELHDLRCVLFAVLSCIVGVAFSWGDTAQVILSDTVPQVLIKSKTICYTADLFSEKIFCLKILNLQKFY